MTARPKFQYVRSKKLMEKTGSELSEKNHKNALASIGCAVCWRIYGPHEPAAVELHHLRTGGWGKGSYKTLIPLCTEHHRGNLGIHGLGTKGFITHYGFGQDELLVWALSRIGLNDVKM